MDLFSESGAVISDCRQYRYKLWRKWSEAPVLLFIMLNPSTADELNNDPTVTRCERRARALGYGGLTVVNLFALRSTDPEALYQHIAPVGPLNDDAIVDAAKEAGMVICGWGEHGHLNGRGQYVIDLVRSNGVVPHYLKLNLDGTPRHPLYVAYKQMPVVWL